MVRLQQFEAWSSLDYLRHTLGLTGREYEQYEQCPSPDVFDTVFEQLRELVAREAAKQARENMARVALIHEDAALQALCQARDVVYVGPPGDDEGLVAANVRHACNREECEQRAKEERGQKARASRTRPRAAPGSAQRGRASRCRTGLSGQRGKRHEWRADWRADQHGGRRRAVRRCAVRRRRALPAAGL
jgi:hypothetical protein